MPKVIGAEVFMRVSLEECSVNKSEEYERKMWNSCKINKTIRSNEYKGD